MIDAGRYVGAPWQARGCWELLRRVYAEQLGITLPTYADDYGDGTLDTVVQLIMAETQSWSPVAGGREREGDGALFKGRPRHIGVVLGGGLFLHMMEGQSAVIESYRTPLWRRQLLGFYRHREAP